MSSTCYIGQRSHGLNELFFVILFFCSSPSCDVMGCIHQSEEETLSSAEALLKVSRRLKTPRNRFSLAAMWNLEHFGGNLQQPPFCRKPTLMKLPEGSHRTGTGSYCPYVAVARLPQLQTHIICLTCFTFLMNRELTDVGPFHKDKTFSVTMSNFFFSKINDSLSNESTNRCTLN